MSIQAKLSKEPPYKLLACDGGGIRGIISIEILAKIEDELRASSGKPDLVLADYFDYVAGTSTGAIIAMLVSLGFSVAEMRTFYLQSGAQMFEKAPFWERWFWKFRPQRLAEMLQRILSEKTGEMEPTLGSAKLRTLLMLVLRNATTDSPWPISNNPRAKYNDLATRGPDSNLHLPLWQLVRASTAAALHQQDFLCRIFGRCLAGDPLDREVGDVIRQGIPGVPKLFTYVRYNADLSREGLATLGLDHIRPEHVQQMDSVAHVSEMQQAGRAAARRYVDTNLQFAGFPP